MTALTADRNTPAFLGDLRSGSVGAAALIFAGAMIMRNATGFLVPASTAVGLIGAGRSEHVADNSAGADGDIAVRFRPGIYRFANSATTDEITDADIGAVCYAVDDQTVANTSATNTRSKAGFVEIVDTLGVWVRFDEALTKLA